jgi:hypothetical protein
MTESPHRRDGTTGGWRDASLFAAVGGVVYAVVVLVWMRSNGLYFAGGDPVTTALGVGYAGGGLWLVAAVPLYLLARLSLCTPAIVTAGLFGNTVYMWAYGTHLDPLSSYLTVWPLLFALAVLAGGLEAVLRTGTERFGGVGGLRRLL